MYHNNSSTIGILSAATTENIREIPKEECGGVTDNIARHAVCKFPATSRSLFESCYGKHMTAMQSDQYN